jgi:hypothetical protein
MLEVLIRVLVGWTALSGLTVAIWSVLVPRYKRAMNRQSAKVHQLPVPSKRQAA